MPERLHSPQVLAAVHQAFASGVDVMLWICAGIAIASALLAALFLPRQLTRRGHRLAFSNGILVLTAVALALILAYRAQVNGLVALYAIGVFTGFTMAGSGMVKHHLREADFLILESNHDLEMLKVGPYPWYIKQRVMSRTGHLSNSIVSEFLADSEVFDGRARHLVLAHVSETNKTPDLARICAEEALGRRAGEFAFRGTLHVASQRIPLGPFDL